MKKNWFNRYAVLIILCLIPIFGMLPLFQKGFFSIHDDEQIGRLYELDKVIRMGHIPPRLAPDLGFGYGYPHFNFYPSFIYYVAEIFVLLGFSFIDSIKIMIALGFVLAAWFMYLFSKEYTNSLGAFISAVAYTYAPYHAVDVYVRGALPEFWSFVWIPALFWVLTKLSRTKKNYYVIFLGLIIASFVTTHNLLVMMSGLFLGIYAIFLLMHTENKKDFVIKSIFGIILGFGLSAYFWLPSFWERKYTMIELLTTELANYTQHFVYLPQFWNSPWGYGGSTFGTSDGLSLQIGKIHLIVGLLVSILVFFHRMIKREIKTVSILFLCLLALSIFLQSFYSKSLWDLIRFFWYIQFPWRFLVFSAFTASFLIGMSTWIIKDRRLQLLSVVILAIIVISLNAKFFQPQEYYKEVKDTDYIRNDVIKWNTSRLAFEYVPNGIRTKTSPLGNTIIDIGKEDIAKSSFTIISGTIAVREIENLPQEKVFTVSSNEEALLQINTFSFPGWEVFIDNQKVRYNDNNKLKLIQVPIPKGQFTVRAVFTDTSVRTIGNFLSVLSFSSLVFYFFILFFRRKNETR